jgi:hypothetical protein
MSLPVISDYYIKDSKSGKPIPVVNDVHLHSAYNPEKEAQAFVEKHIDDLKKSNKVLVLGLGFGYHLSQILYHLRREFDSNFTIWVVEPNISVYLDWREIFTAEQDTNLNIVAGVEVEELYKEKDFQTFLLDKPKLIAHPASFNLYQEYFKSFLTFSTSDFSEDLADYIHDSVFKNYAVDKFEGQTFEQTINTIQRKEKLTREDFIFLMVDEFKKQGEVHE